MSSAYLRQLSISLSTSSFLFPPSPPFPFSKTEGVSFEWQQNKKKNKKNNKETASSSLSADEVRRKEFTEMRKEVIALGVSGLDKRKRKRVEEEYLKTLGAKVWPTSEFSVECRL